MPDDSKPQDKPIITEAKAKRKSKGKKSMKKGRGRVGKKKSKSKAGKSRAAKKIRFK